MGKTNRTAALERKIILLLGEREQKQEEIAKADRYLATLPGLRARVSAIGDLLQACEAIIKDDQPEWTGASLKPSRPFVHKISIRFGNCSKLALDVLRIAGRPMRVKEIAVEVLEREGHDSPDAETITKVGNTVGNALKKKLIRGYVATDGAWPGLWWTVKPAAEE